MLVDRERAPLTEWWGAVELSAQVDVRQDGERVRLQSEAVSVTIAKRDAKELDLVRPVRGSLAGVLLLGSHNSPKSFDYLEKFLSKLSDSNMKKHCTAALLLSRLRAAVTADQKQIAIVALERFEATLDPVSLDYYLIMRAEVHLSDKDAKSAKTVLKRVKHPSHEARVIEDELSTLVP